MDEHVITLSRLARMPSRDDTIRAPGYSVVGLEVDTQVASSDTMAQEQSSGVWCPGERLHSALEVTSRLTSEVFC